MAENRKQWQFVKELRQYGDSELRYLKEVIDHGAMSIFDVDNGMIERFEKAFAQYTGAKYAMAKANAMVGLINAVGASGAGVGDEVICDPVVHFGGMSAMLYNCVPVFADIDPDTYNVSVESFKSCITPLTKAAIITHIWGQMAEMDQIRDICKENNIFLIEDCAHVTGASYKGIGAGNYGDIGVFSFQEYKQLSTGDGSMCIVNRQDLKENMKQTWAFSGESPLFMNFNTRMNAVTAAVGLGQLEKMDSILEYYGKTQAILEDAIKDCKWIKPRKKLEGGVNAPYWFACTFEGDKVGLDYNKLKQLNDELGIGLRFGFNERAPYEFDFFRLSTAYRHPDCPIRCPIYTAKSTYRYKQGLCPNVEEIMPRLITVRLIFLSIEDAKAMAEKIKQAIAIMEE